MSHSRIRKFLLSLFFNSSDLCSESIIFFVVFIIDNNNNENNDDNDSIILVELCRRLESDPTLGEITHVIVDEVHERSEESDFLLMILRDTLPKVNN